MILGSPSWNVTGPGLVGEGVTWARWSMLNGGRRRFVLELVGGMPSVEKYVNRVQDLQTKLTFSTMYIQATIIWIEFVLKIKSAERVPDVNGNRYVIGNGMEKMRG